MELDCWTCDSDRVGLVHGLVLRQAGTVSESDEGKIVRKILIEIDCSLICSKLPLIMGLVGKLIYSTMIVVNTIFVNWPLEYIIYTATIPSAFTGADVAIFANAFAYITDVSSERDRTIRITILDVCYLSTMPTGVALGE